ncbi:MAG: threonine synthase [Lachnospiraceae bacterium]|nr:threonine synthase [Lachnospiraceae bacterium]
MEILYKSTRSNTPPVSASKAILTGLAPDGGLYVPSRIPALPKTLLELSALSYQDLAYEIMSLYFTDFTEDELRACINRAYDDKFDTRKIAPVVKKDGVYFLELFHGPTIAFKDMALSILPHLLVISAAKNNADKRIVILTATSGDTGKAAMAGFADVPGTRIAVFFPDGGVSNIQRLQMVTQRGDNTHVAAINGNFDDAQTAVKNIFSDKALAAEAGRKGFRFSSANSINIGRLVPQIVYYVYAYCQLLAAGEIDECAPINITVPTGNFGNILAAWYASLMGLPVHKLICASNENKVLYDFFDTGVYDRERPFILTSSPSMDILISSNLERLIYHLTGDSPMRTKAFMESLSENGQYEISQAMKEGLSDFCGVFVTEEENFEGIRRLYNGTGYVIDPHTGIAFSAYRKYLEESADDTPTIIASTASPFKFAEAVVGAIAPDAVEGKSDFELIDYLSDLADIDEPYAITDIRTAPIRHKTLVDPEDMPDDVRSFLGI